MDRFKPPNPELQIQKKPPQVVEREQAEKGERDEKLALEILQACVQTDHAKQLTPNELAAYCEVIWQWVTTDQWPPKN